MIQTAGSNLQYAFYIKKGLTRSYLIDSKGKEHIYSFASENWIIGDLEALEYGGPTELFIDCIEDAEVIVFWKDDIFNENMSHEQLQTIRKMLSRRVGRLQRRVLMMMGTPAADRYKYFLDVYPDLVERVPQHMIASYLGMAPQTLSTLRSREYK
ncbi:MAG: Crp/Fnr family transcriptional regulator [Flavobacteriales bacterium]|nr:Crp/Fnr family transcriptional regulator [Flavobacteriales bacterium]